nr:hypothetical protein [Tanacetum cinerariifolium]
MFNCEVVRVMQKRRDGVVFKEKGEEFCLDLKEDKVVPIVDGVLEGTFGGERDGDFTKGEEVHGRASIGHLRKGLVGCRDDVVLKEKGEEFCLDLKEDKVVPIVDRDLKGTFGGEGDDDFIKGEVSLNGWKKKLEWMPWIVVEEKNRKKMMEKNEDGGDYLIKSWWLILVKHGDRCLRIQKMFIKMKKS